MEAIKTCRFMDANACLIKAQDFTRELQASLDRRIPISDYLYSLYAYFIARLVHANMRKAIEPIQEVISFVLELKETWIQAIKASGEDCTADSYHL